MGTLCWFSPYTSSLGMYKNVGGDTVLSVNVETGQIIRRGWFALEVTECGVN